MSKIKSLNEASTSSGTYGGIKIPSIEEKNKKIQQEALMEKIRAKNRLKPKTFEDLRKSARNHFNEKNMRLDPGCKVTLQAALDKLQHYIKVSSRHGLVERLESVSRQLGLKFMEDVSVLFISTDMFYLEILLDAGGNLTDVKVHHECKIEQQSCSELVDCLKRGDFADFTVQLEGLSSIYQLNAELKVKNKAFVALQAMETDIFNMYKNQILTGNSFERMASSSVGLVLQRRGGHPMKLTYLSPLICAGGAKILKKKTNVSIDQVIRSPWSLSATVNLEGSSANKLQIAPTVTFNKDAHTGVNTPTFSPLTLNNSMLMPATYVLRLNTLIPVSYDALAILNLPLVLIGDGPGGISESAHKPTPIGSIMSLCVQTASNNTIKTISKGLYVNLYNETHCYFFTDNRNLKATSISSLAFTEPSQVPKIITFLKKQALYYTLLASCVREEQKQLCDMDNTIILEVTAVSFNQITVELQHPYDESLATVDFILADGTVTCKIYSLNHDYTNLSGVLTRTVQKVYSIPFTVYKLLRLWNEEQQKRVQGNIPNIDAGGCAGNGSGGGSSTANVSKGPNANGKFSLALGSSDPTAPGGLGSETFTSINAMKIGAQVRSLTDAIAASTATAAAIRGLTNLKRETDPTASLEKPSQNTDTVGKTINLSQSQSSTANLSNIEIADKYKNIWKDKTSNLKHCVSITPIPGEVALKSVSAQQIQGSSLDVSRSGGIIEIIPLNAQHSHTATNVVSGSVSGTNSSTPSSSTITITPISGSIGKDVKEKKSCAIASTSATSSGGGISKRQLEGGNLAAQSAGGDLQKEKKRKKKRDDSPMGPPEKVYSRQNSPAATSDASSTTVVRKFTSPSSSPKSSSSGGIASAPPGSTLSSRPSPKHSPVYSSPKHNTASNSPKSPFGTHSPKHSSSGKPSMSTLKSATAATTLSPKGDKSNSAGGGVVLVRSFPGVNNSSSSCVQSTVTMTGSTTASSSTVKNRGEKEKLSTTSNPPAITSVSGTVISNQTIASAGFKPNLSAPALQTPQFKSVANLSAGPMDLNTTIRKGMAGGAVSLMTSTTPVTLTSISVSAPSTMAVALNQVPQQPQGPHSSGSSSGEGSLSSGGGNSSGSSSSSTEYMVKPSQEGLKLTINKTSSAKSTLSVSSASTSKGKSGSASCSTSSSLTVRKQHTGLKPGVQSGPASKKTLSSKTSSSSTSKHAFQKSNSSGNLCAKLASGNSSNSGNSAVGTFVHDIGAPRRRPSTGNTGSNLQRKSSPGSISPAASTSTGSISQPSSRFDHNTDMMKILQYASPTMAANMEGFIRGLHNKFQIPKLSQRAIIGSTTPTTDTVGKQSANVIVPSAEVVTTPSISKSISIACETPISLSSDSSTGSVNRETRKGATITPDTNTSRFVSASSLSSNVSTTISSANVHPTTILLNTTSTSTLMSQSESKSAASSSPTTLAVPKHIDIDVSKLQTVSNPDVKSQPDPKTSSKIDEDLSRNLSDE